MNESVRHRHETDLPSFRLEESRQVPGSGVRGARPAKPDRRQARLQDHDVAALDRSRELRPKRLTVLFVELPDRGRFA